MVMATTRLGQHSYREKLEVEGLGDEQSMDRQLGTGLVGEMEAHQEGETEVPELRVFVSLEQQRIMRDTYI
jgi:hypothetical protein